MQKKVEMTKRVDLLLQLRSPCKTPSLSRMLMTASMFTTIKWEKENWVKDNQLHLMVRWQEVQLLQCMALLQYKNLILVSLVVFSQQPETVTPQILVTKDYCLCLEEIDITCRSTIFIWWDFERELRIVNIFLLFDILQIRLKTLNSLIF